MNIYYNISLRHASPFGVDQAVMPTPRGAGPILLLHVYIIYFVWFHQAGTEAALPLGLLLTQAQPSRCPRFAMPRMRILTPTSLRLRGGGNLGRKILLSRTEPLALSQSDLNARAGDEGSEGPPRGSGGPALPPSPSRVSPFPSRAPGSLHSLGGPGRAVEVGPRPPPRAVAAERGDSTRFGLQPPAAFSAAPRVPVRPPSDVPRSPNRSKRPSRAGSDPNLQGFQTSTCA